MAATLSTRSSLSRTPKDTLPMATSASAPSAQLGQTGKSLGFSQTQKFAPGSLVAAAAAAAASESAAAAVESIGGKEKEKGWTAFHAYYAKLPSVRGFLFSASFFLSLF
jgi:hypothetical protein